MKMDKMPTPSAYTDISDELHQQVRRDAAKALEAQIFKEFDTLVEPKDVSIKTKAKPYTESDFKDAVNQLEISVAKRIPDEYITPMGMTGMGKGSVLSDAMYQDTHEFLKKNPVDELKRLINQTDNEIVIKMLAHKLGRQFSYDKDSKRVIEYISRLSMPYYKEMKPEGLSDDNLSLLEYHLKDIPGVGVQVIYEDYPEEASIIIRVDQRALTDFELEAVPTRIQDAIKEYKPKGLKELEVIYHNKEVY